MSKAQPHSTNEEVNYATCIGSDCMAWQWDDSDEMDIELTHKHATEEEIIKKLYSNPIFKVSDTDGWCKLMDKEY
ncbi:MAG: hypothetical protein DRP93_06055 [Candidatus Neomarinimicrobiota bacterium]|nr:MAG: hypothetical protein DRP93_06055 [Candidatus Neomarinimicrobiota bacterium]